MSLERGERGPAGDHGQAGDRGRPGDPGGTGLTGDTGPTGDTGRTGATGQTGLTGRRGAEGPPVSTRQWRRFKALIYAVMGLILLSNAFLWWQQQHFSRQECETRNARSVATTQSLARLVQAHRLDDSPHAAAVWQSFLEVSEKNPPPPC